MDGPVPIVIVEPGPRVWPWTMYCEAALAVMVWEPTVIGPSGEYGVATVMKGRAMVEEPMISWVWELEV